LDSGGGSPTTLISAGTLNLARSEAIKTGYRSALQIVRPATCADDGSGWELGWILYVDENQDSEISASETVIRTASGQRITVATARPTGRTPASATPELSGALRWAFVICKPGQDTLEVVLANSGRARPADRAALSVAFADRPNRVVDDILRGVARA
jgi:Tfp pilus assembly protein FimT